MISTRCNGGNEQPDISESKSNENTNDEKIYSNHNYFDLSSMDSIQKCNCIFKQKKSIKFQ